MTSLSRAPTALRTYTIAALLLTGSADVLFFGYISRPLGIPVALFVALVALAIVLCNHRTLERKATVPALLLVAALLALTENVAWNSLTFALLALTAFALAVVRRLPSGLGAIHGLGWFARAAPLALVRDDRRRRRAIRRTSGSGRTAQERALAWVTWVMPVGLAGVFVHLLGSGNPILGRWLSWIEPLALLDLLAPSRIVFWALALLCLWPFLRPRLRRSRAARRADVPATVIEETVDKRAIITDRLFGPAAITRALLLFNAVFAVQTLLDVVYLWGGAELPSGVSYAAYAHRGAYTLVLTALLAAGIVLLAMVPGTPAVADRRIRVLVYFWTGQNVALVLSAMLQLDLYVDAYGLTHQRIAAFLWMALVAVGLVLILVRIARGRSNDWLVGANLAAAAVMLACSCFADLDAAIARFNVEHSREISGKAAASLDVLYLASLGTSALPAIDRYLAVAGSTPSSESRNDLSYLVRLRTGLETEHRKFSQEWRGWTFRNWRISRYLEANAAPVVSSPVEPAMPAPDGPE